MGLEDYARLICAILDIPVYGNASGNGLIQGLHVLFSLYNDFKANPHFASRLPPIQTAQDPEAAVGHAGGAAAGAGMGGASAGAGAFPGY